MNFLKLNKEIIILFVIYLLSNLLFLLNFQAIYWDDWSLYNHDFSTIMSQFKMNGGLIAGYIHNILLSIGNGVFIYRVLVFLAYFMSGFFIYKIVLKVFNHQVAFWVSLLYLIVPLNSAKIALINAPSIFLLFLFYLSFYLLSIYMKNKEKIYLRIIILLLFFISFFLNSLLVFYFTVLMYITFECFKGRKKIDKNFIINIFYTKIDFIFLPIVFFIVNNIYFKPYGLYEGYNGISFNIDNLKIVLKTFKTSLLDPIVISFENSYQFWYISIVLLIVIWSLTLKYNLINKSKKSYVIVVLGILMFILAVFPYAVVGKTPSLISWNSRHQILIPLGVSFILYGFITIYNFNQKVYRFFLVFFISIFVLQNIYYSYRYIKDWYYQVSIEENFKKSETIKKHTTFVQNIKLPNQLANKRPLGFYEQNARLKKAFGDTKRFMVNSKNNINRYKKYRPYKQYNFDQWKFDGHIFLVNIHKTDKTMDFKNFSKLLFFQFVDYNTFLSKVKEYTVLEIKELKDGK